MTASKKFERRALRSVKRAASQMEVGRARSGDVMAPTACGHCGKVLDGASHREGHRPKPGHLCVCTGCGGFNLFGSDLQLSALQDDDVRAMGEDYFAEMSVLRSMIRGMRPS